MDGFVENEDLLVIATTNDLKAVEPAIKDRPSRFDSVINFPPMDHEMREKMLNRLIRDFPTTESRSDLIKKVSQGLSEMTGAELKEYFISAVKLAITKDEVNESGRAILSAEIFREAWEKIRLNRKMIMGFVGG
jgi:SpoVK/Ycf46/Vps4 family AAA+-type ATPase